MSDHRPADSVSDRAVPLTALRTGDRARLVEGASGRETGGHQAFSHDDRASLAALGLTSSSPFRVARAGDPWIVQVRSTRIGLSDAVARCLRVLPEPIR